MAQLLILLTGSIGVLAYLKNTARIEEEAKKINEKIPPSLIESMQHYGGGSNVNRFNTKTKYVVQEHVGQFGLIEQMRYDSDGAVTRTWDIGLDNF